MMYIHTDIAYTHSSYIRNHSHLYTHTYVYTHTGLDSFNAALLVDCLKELATHNGTNIVMTIHQPRSNVFTGFDRNLVLNQGEVTYFGHTKKVASYFASIGHAIPADYNPADFLIGRCVCGFVCVCSYLFM